jgi:hypothetical protein
MTLSCYLSRSLIKSVRNAAKNEGKAEAGRVMSHLDVVFVLALQLLLYMVYFSFCQLPQKAYFSPFIVLEAFRHPPVIIIIFSNLLFCSLSYRKLSWHTIDPTSGARIFISLIAMTIMWQFATYDYNFYYDQAHYLDRFLLIVLTFLIYWHPLFAPIFTIFSIIVASQLHYPLPEAAWLWPDKKILFDAMILFNAYLFFATCRKVTPHTFLYLALCLTGGIYFHAGMAKLSIGPEFYSWLMDDRLSNLIVSSYLQGWFGFVDVAYVVRLAKSLSTFDFPMALGTLIIELSALFILWSKNASRLILTCIILLHVAIGVASGILFWKWFVYDLALMFFIQRAQAVSVERIYSRKSFLLSVAVISLSFLYFRTVHFAWFDTKLNNFFTIYGIGQSGRVYNLGPRFFSPYDITFGQSRFYYLTKEKVLVGTYGTSQSYQLARLLEAASPADVESLKTRYGASLYHESLAKSFSEFLKLYVTKAQKHGSKFVAINYLAPPYHFGRVSVGDRYDFQERLDTLHVYYEEHLFTGEDIRILQKKLIMKISLTNDDPHNAGR